MVKTISENTARQQQLYPKRSTNAQETPARATFVVAGAILSLAPSLPLVSHAKFTSLLLLGVFTSVNLSLFLLGHNSEKEFLGKYKWWGLFGAVLSLAIAAYAIVVG